MTYDILSRPLEITGADGNKTNLFYNVLTFEGNLRLRTRARDSLLREVTNYQRLDGRAIAVEQHNMINGVDTPLITHYTFSSAGLLTGTLDPQNHLTSATYDSFGRMISLTNADTGTTEFQYNIGGDLGARITENLRNQTKRIHMKYTKHRLDVIEYPFSGYVLEARKSNGGRVPTTPSLVKPPGPSLSGECGPARQLS